MTARLIGVIEPAQEPVAREVLVDLVRELMAWCPPAVTMSAPGSKLFARAHDAIAREQRSRPADRIDAAVLDARIVGRL